MPVCQSASASSWWRPSCLPTCWISPILTPSALVLGMLKRTMPSRTALLLWRLRLASASLSSVAIDFPAMTALLAVATELRAARRFVAGIAAAFALAPAGAFALVALLALVTLAATIFLPLASGFTATAFFASPTGFVFAARGFTTFVALAAFAPAFATEAARGLILAAGFLAI